MKRHHNLAAQLTIVLAASSCHVGATPLHPGRRDPKAPPIDYGDDHPFILMARARQQHDQQRSLQALDDDWKYERPPDPAELKFNTTKFRPIRMKFDTTYLPDTTEDANHVKFLKEHVLPEVTEFWSRTLSVFPAKKLYVNSDYCKLANAKDFVFGLSDVDIMMYVVANYFCDGVTHSLAESCDWDDYDRPIGGNIYFCFDAFPLDEETGEASEDVKRLAIAAAIHEVGHVLGVHESDFAYFWDVETGLPRTEREVEEGQVNCVTGKKEKMDLPSNSTVRKGVDGESGQIYYELVTPRVVQVARNHFDCQSLTGVRMENQPTSEGTCMGNHIEERLYFNHLMSAVATHPSIPEYFSPITLALFEDSGWYRVNYTVAANSPYGRGRGCDFVNKPCIDRATGGVPDHGAGLFCNTTDKIETFHCDPTHSVIAACNLVDWGERKDVAGPPKEFQWFKTDSNLGGHVANADYCPTWTHFVWNCKGNEPRRKFPGELYGDDDSRCVDTIGPDAGRPFCMESRCNEIDRTVEVVVEGSDGSALKCEYDGQVIPFPGDANISIVCPRLAEFCPDMICPANCAGRGVCNRTAAVPKCDCFEGEDETSPTCSTYEIAYTEEELSPPPPAPPTFGWNGTDFTMSNGERCAVLPRRSSWQLALPVLVGYALTWVT